jgi:hypothetical protein
MALRIGQFNTTCHVPRPHQREAEVVDRLARGRFARDLHEHLGPSLARQPGIVRIRRLGLRVIVPVSELNEEALSLKWRQAFGKALFTELAYPTGAGPFEVFRAESVAVFISSAIRDLLDGTASTQWQYAEFEPFFRQGNTPAALALICEWPHLSMAVLLELAQRRVLDRLLARFDDLAMERLFVLLAPAEADSLSIDDLIMAARLALGRLPEKTSALRSRQYALSLFVESHRGQPWQSPRAIYHALLALAVLLNQEVFWPGAPSEELWMKGLPSSVTVVLESVSKRIRGRMPPSPPVEITGGTRMRRETASPRAAELHQLLTSLRNELKIPPPSTRPADVRWISSEWCGLFFLTSALVRLGWIPAWRQLADFQSGGVACLIAGLALAIAEKFDPAVPMLDPGIALFAGYLGDPDLAHLRRVFQEFPRETRMRVLRAALPHDAVGDAANQWKDTVDFLTGNLLQNFASRIRGFRQASQQGIVRSFIARPGCIRIETERLVVFPAPSPFHVALHIAGIDEPIERVTWLGGRRLEFELGDL